MENKIDFCWKKAAMSHTRVYESRITNFKMNEWNSGGRFLNDFIYLFLFRLYDNKVPWLKFFITSSKEQSCNKFRKENFFFLTCIKLEKICFAAYQICNRIKMTRKAKTSLSYSFNENSRNGVWWSKIIARRVM